MTNKYKGNAPKRKRKPQTTFTAHKDMDDILRYRVRGWSLDRIAKKLQLSRNVVIGANWRYNQNIKKGRTRI